MFRTVTAICTIVTNLNLYIYCNLHVFRVGRCFNRLCVTDALCAKTHYSSRILLAPASISALLAWPDPHPNQDLTYGHRICTAHSRCIAHQGHTAQPYYQWETQPCTTVTASASVRRSHRHTFETGFALSEVGETGINFQIWIQNVTAEKKY
jgi:hypothetical protein